MLNVQTTATIQYGQQQHQAQVFATYLKCHGVCFFNAFNFDLKWKEFMLTYIHL